MLYTRYELRDIFIIVTTFQVEVKEKVKLIKKEYCMLYDNLNVSKENPPNNTDWGSIWVKDR